MKLLEKIFPMEYPPLPYTYGVTIFFTASVFVLFMFPFAILVLGPLGFLAYKSLGKKGKSPLPSKKVIFFLGATMFPFFVGLLLLSDYIAISLLKVDGSGWGFAMLFFMPIMFLVTIFLWPMVVGSAYGKEQRKYALLGAGASFLFIMVVLPGVLSILS